MSKNYKNEVLHDHISIGEERRKALTKEVLKDSTPFPDTLTYEDIDSAFKKWVEDELDLSFDGQKLPTMVLYSNERFSEYSQSWKFNDEKHNLILNFKTISREFNPKQGELHGQCRNIPGDRRYTMKRVLTTDENGREYYLVYKMKQPFTVDLSYKVSIITNKIELINNFNQKIQDKFKAIDCYIRANGHYIPMKLDDISDESEVSDEDRKFYSQSYSIKVLSYIIDEDSFEVYEEPVLKFKGVDMQLGDNFKSSADIEDFDDGTTKMTLKFFRDCEPKCKFTMDAGLYVTSIELENINSFKLEINGDEQSIFVLNDHAYTDMIYTEEGIPANEAFQNFVIKENDEVRIKNVKVGYSKSFGKIIMCGKSF